MQNFRNKITRKERKKKGETHYIIFLFKKSFLIDLKHTPFQSESTFGITRQSFQQYNNQNQNLGLPTMWIFKNQNHREKEKQRDHNEKKTQNKGSDVIMFIHMKCET